MTQFHPIDPATFLFSLSLFSFVMAALLYASNKSFGGTVYGLKEYAGAMLSVGIAFMMFYMRGVIPDFISLVLANIIIVGCPIYSVMAHARFYQQPEPKIIIHSLTMLSISGIAASFAIGHPVAGITISVSFPMAILFFINAWFIFRGTKWHDGSTHERWVAGFSVAGLVFISLVLALRAAMVIIGSGSSVSMFSNSNYQIAFFIAATMAIVAPAIGFLLLVYERIHQEILDSSRRDGLTGLFNRHIFMAEGAKLDASNANYAVVMIDIDFFKRINDTYGHASGDAALIHTAKMFSRLTRDFDLVARYGGEEFCVLLHDCNQSIAESFATRIVEAAREQRVRLPGGETISFTISAGYAVKGPGLSVANLLEIADQGLYHAKRNGRNRVGNLTYPTVYNQIPYESDHENQTK